MYTSVKWVMEILPTAFKIRNISSSKDFFFSRDDKNWAQKNYDYENCKS